MSSCISAAQLATGFIPTFSGAALNWYAVQTRSNFEKRVLSELTTKSVESFLPSMRQVRQWADRKKELDIPLFPGYLFVRMADSDKSRLEVLRTQGTVRILGTGGEIEPVPDSEIEAVRQLLTSKLPFVDHEFVCEGDRVRVRRGPLAGVEGLLVRIKSQDRLVISVHMLCQSVATEIDSRDVESVRRVDRSMDRLEQSSFAI